MVLSPPPAISSIWGRRGPRLKYRGLPFAFLSPLSNTSFTTWAAPTDEHKAEQSTLTIK